MYSFYGGPQGQSFSFSAIFPNRVALKEDLNQTGFSPVQLNEYVFINYGLQNDDQKYFNANRDEDNEAYNGRSYNSTLWQKIYTKELVPTEEPNKFYYHNNKYHITDIEYVPNVNPETSEFKYCYICLGVLNGYTPEFQLEPTITLVPDKLPSVNLDNNNTEFPKIQFELPRAAKFVWNTKEATDFGGAESGDYYINETDGKLYKLVEVQSDNGAIKTGEEVFQLVPQFEITENNYRLWDEENSPSVGLISSKDKYNHYNFDFVLPYIKFEVDTKNVEVDSDAGVTVTGTGLNQTLTFKIPRGNTGHQGDPGQGLEILPASTITVEDPDVVLDNEFITSKLPQKIEVYQVKPIVITQLQEDNSKLEISYWCTYNDGWSILPLGGGGTTKLEWEELGN